MKKGILFFVIILFGLWCAPVFSQNNNDEPEALGLPGDNLNLYAVLDVFQKSKTLEDFERSINDKETNINNLDLDNDRNIDYIKVVSYKKGKSHSIVLQVAINSKENQDVAVIDVNTNSSGKVRVQIIGDEDLYGENYIVEPSSDTVSGTPNPGYTGSGTVIVNNTTNNYSTTTNNSGLYAANDWPVIVYLFSPVYVIYRSPWHWGYYPLYWHPWAPVYYYNYWGYHSHYYGGSYYRRTNYILYPSNYSYYSSRRNSSTIVRQNRRSGNYNATYEGRDYRRPAASTRPTTRPGTRPTTPTTRPGTRPTAPSTRPTTPTTRPVTRPTTPTTRPTAPTTRPGTRPTSPTTRPTAPTTRPATSNTGSNRQTTPSTRRN